MTHAKVTSKLVTKAFASSLVAVGLALAGCGTEKIESSPDRTSKEIFEKSVDQGAKGKKGTGTTITTKSVKGLIKKDAAN